MVMDFSFLHENLVYRMLTRGEETNHLKNWANTVFVLNNSDRLLVYLDNPEIEWNIVYIFFNKILVIQEGRIIKELSNLDTSKEALVLFKDNTDKSKLDLFVVREEV